MGLPDERSGRTRRNAVTYDPLSDVVKDEAIEARRGVRIVQPDGSLGPVRQLSSIIHSLKRPEEHLVLLSRMEPSSVTPSDSDDPEALDQRVAICKIASRAELLKQKSDRERMLKLQKKAMKEKAPKQIELNWAIGRNDLDVKLGQLEDFLEQGKTVELILAAKRKARKATEEEAMNVLKHIQKKITEMHAKEVRPMEGQLLKQALFTLKKRGPE